MARKVGIKQNTTQVLISGARVAFDARGTSEADQTRDPQNYKALEKPLREYQWRVREAAKKASKSEAA